MVADGDHRWAGTPVSDLKTRGSSRDSDGPIDEAFHTTNNTQQRLEQTLGFLWQRLSRRASVAGQRFTADARFAGKNFHTRF